MIVGVIASITIPSLIADVQDQQHREAWKKCFSDISQATKRIVTENGGSIWDNSNTDAAIDSLNMKNEYKKYLNVISDDTSSNIFNGITYSQYKNSNSTFNYNTDTRPSLLLSNGALIRIASKVNCSITLGTLTDICGDIRVDINGVKGPNMIGRDFFGLWIIKKGSTYISLPYGITGDTKSCVNPSTGTDQSDGCSAQILYQ